MKITIREDNLPILFNDILFEDFKLDNPYLNKINADVESLNNFIRLNGSLMVSKENEREYMVYELIGLAKLIGHRYCMCRLIKDGDGYGAVYVKPLSMFKIKN